MKLARRSLIAGSTAALTLPKAASAQEKVVRYGIFMTDIPLTTGQPDRGANAYQYTGLTIYDPLIAWELDVSDRPGKMIPGLATEWKVDDADKTKWIFKLRPGVTFHDGTPFNAEAVKFGLDRVIDKNSPYYNATLASAAAQQTAGIASYTVASLPAHGTLYRDAALTQAVGVGTAVSGATLYFVPDANWNGSTSFDYSAADNNSASSSSAEHAG